MSPSRKESRFGWNDSKEESLLRILEVDRPWGLLASAVLYHGVTLTPSLSHAVQAVIVDYALQWSFQNL